MEITVAHMVAIFVTVVILAVAAMVGVTTALFHSLNAKHEAFKADLAAHQKVTNMQMESIQSTVAKGIEEHQTWRDEMDKTNTRLDQLMAQLIARKN